MNELERTALNEILRTVTYIAEKVDKIEQMLEPQLSETDKKEVLDLIKGALSDGKGDVVSTISDRFMQIYDLKKGK